MISVFFHLGDWTTSTVDLSPTERGVYFDLLCRYYQKERPLMQEECTRIARAYAPHEQEAMQYVLQTFFELKDGVYVHARCEEEIQKMRLTIGKRKKAAEARWSRAREGKSETDGDASAEALSMHADCKCISKCNADAMQTINHKPETTNQEREESAKARPPRKKPASACPFEAGSQIPDDLADVAEKAGIANPQAVFEKFVDHAVATGRRLVDWKAGFRMWCANEVSFHPQGQQTAAQSKAVVQGAMRIIEERERAREAGLF